MWSPRRDLRSLLTACRAATLLPLLIAVALLAIPVRCDASPHTHSLFAAPVAVAAAEPGAPAGDSRLHGHDHGLGHDRAAAGTAAADPGSMVPSEFANWAPAPAIASPVEAIGGDAGVPVDGGIGDDAAPNAASVSPETPPPNALPVA